MNPNPETLPPILTVAEVAAMFRVDKHTVTRWARTGRVASFRTPGGHLRFRRADLEQMMTDTNEVTE